MEYAETEGRREDCSDLPVCLLMVLHKLAAGVREVDGIDSFFPKLLAFLFEP